MKEEFAVYFWGKPADFDLKYSIRNRKYKNELTGRNVSPPFLPVPLQAAEDPYPADSGSCVSLRDGHSPPGPHLCGGTGSRYTCASLLSSRTIDGRACLAEVIRMIAVMIRKKREMGRVTKTE